MFERLIEKFFKAPAEALDRVVERSEQAGRSIRSGAAFSRAESYWKMLGPGLTTGAADDDPSGVATYSQAGAQFGPRFLWLALYSFPLMAVVQEMCARIGIATGQGLAANIRDHYPRWMISIAAVALFAANAFNIGADLGAMAKSVQLVVPSFGFGYAIVGFALLSLLFQIFTTYERYAKYLKWLALILLAYVFSALSSAIDWGSAIHATLIPSITMSKDGLLLVAAVLGTTISPYLFFWQTSQEVEEERMQKRANESTPANPRAIRQMRVDVWSGMFLSNIVMFFIIAAAAGTLFVHHVSIQTVEDVAGALRPLAGQGAFLLFTVGIIGVGMLAIPVLAGSASYAISESFDWPEGLNRKLKEASAFYGVIIFAMLIGILLNFVGIDPVKALIYSAIANAILAPVILFFIVHLSNDKKVMGEHANHSFTRVFGWLVVVLMTMVGVATIVSLL